MKKENTSAANAVAGQAVQTAAVGSSRKINKAKEKARAMCGLRAAHSCKNSTLKKKEDEA